MRAFQRCRACGVPRFAHWLIGSRFVDPEWLLRDFDARLDDGRIRSRKGYDWPKRATGA